MNSFLNAIHFKIETNIWLLIVTFTILFHISIYCIPKEGAKKILSTSSGDLVPDRIRPSSSSWVLVQWTSGRRLEVGEAAGLTSAVLVRWTSGRRSEVVEAAELSSAVRVLDVEQQALEYKINTIRYIHITLYNSIIWLTAGAFTTWVHILLTFFLIVTDSCENVPSQY